MAEQHTLEIKDLYASVETKEGRKQILKGVNLTVHSGETHAIMGPNGSGKSTLAYTLAGHPKYEVDSGEALLDGVDILKQTPDLRAKEGLFLAMQYPVEVPGVSMTNFLRTAKTEVDGKAPAIRTWTKELGAAMKKLRMDPKFASRSVNEGFSGGEKKRAEVLPARTAQAEVRHHGRDRFRPRRGRPAHRVRRREPRQGEQPDWAS